MVEVLCQYLFLCMALSEVKENQEAFGINLMMAPGERLQRHTWD